MTRATPLCIALLSTLTAAPIHAGELLAFPGAEGAGRLAQGGRGGKVVKVTNLNDSGAGSLRAAIDAKEPRIVVFDVSGVIQLRSALTIKAPRITIAGQSAPGEGVTLRDHPLIVAADDVVVRYIRSRLGDTSGVQDDAISVNKGRRVILDHVSASWSVDETLSVSANYTDPNNGPYDVTVQWSMITESLNASKHEKGSHGYGTLTRGGRGSRFSYHHNLWASHSARMPRPGNYTSRVDDSVGAFFDFRNNVFYNWGGDSSGYNADTESLASYNFVGNTYIPGPDSKARIAFKESNPFARSHFADNAMDGKVPADPWSLVTGQNVVANRLAKAIDMPPIVTEGWDSAYRRVLAGAGASVTRDAVDVRTIAGVEARTHRIINTQNDVGGWPASASQPAPRDSDEDGMPDAWEQKNGLDPNKAADATRIDKDGYTAIESYLNSLVL